MRCFLLICVLSFFVESCKDKNELLSPKKMQIVLWDMIQLEAYTQQPAVMDSLKRRHTAIVGLQQQIFTLHGINKDQYLKSYKYYNEHPESMRNILDSIAVNAEKDRDKIMARKFSGNKMSK